MFVQKTVSQGKTSNTIYEQLDKQEKRMVALILECTDQLNPRQMLYLNYVIRKKIASIYPNWDNLHFSPNSPYLREFSMMPTMKNAKNLNDLRTCHR